MQPQLITTVFGREIGIARVEGVSMPIYTTEEVVESIENTWIEIENRLSKSFNRKPVRRYIISK